ncbi:MAG: hypothetical protein K0Q79_1826 [Flavipsychrobacter sp.]|jgi:hypothetical protein|nr:hypothetical protein [Flavipsychrobacter sp.]
MRLLLLLLCLSASLSIHGKGTDSILHRINFQLHPAVFIPTGQFSNIHSNGYLLGQSKAGFAIVPSIIARVHKNFHAGLYIGFANFQLNPEKSYRLLKKQFDEPGYYTTAIIKESDAGLGTEGLEFTYKFKTELGEIEPYLQIGAGHIIGGKSFATIHRKKANDNYYEDIDMSILPSSLFYPGIGLRINRKMHKIFYLTFSIQYNSGSTTYDVEHTKTDISGNISKTVLSYNQRVSALQIQSGIQLRVFKARRFRHK